MEFKKKEKKVQMGIYVSLKTYKNLAVLAKKHSITRSSVLTQIVEEFFERHNHEMP